MKPACSRQQITHILSIAPSRNTFSSILGWFGQGADLGVHEVNRNMVACTSLCALSVYCARSV